MSKLSSVWLFSEKEDRYDALLIAARALGQTVNAVILDNAKTSGLSSLSVDTLYTVTGASDNQCVEDYAETIAEAIKKGELSRGLVLLSTTKRDKALAARLSVLLDAPLINEATDIRIEDDSLLVEQRLYGGLAIGLKKINVPFTIVTLPPGVFATSTSEQTTNSPRQVLPLDYLTPHHSLMRQERHSKPVDSVELNKAKCVVGIGRGLVAEDDLTLIQSLASCLNAEVGCSRPIAEGEHWLGRERYIGISGVMLKCEVYLALGISGQIQHMVGVNGAKVVIAINKDKNAPVFQAADYGIVGDLYTVVPMLLEKLQS